MKVNIYAVKHKYVNENISHLYFHLENKMHLHYIYICICFTKFFKQLLFLLWISWNLVRMTKYCRTKVIVLCVKCHAYNYTFVCRNACITALSRIHLLGRLLNNKSYRPVYYFIVFIFKILLYKCLHKQGWENFQKILPVMIFLTNQ